MVKFSLYINVDDSIKEDYYSLTKSGLEDQMININVFTNGKNRIDFRGTYFAFEEEDFDKFVSGFKRGRNIIKNIDLIYISASDRIKNTLKDNQLIIRTLNNNKQLLTTDVRLNVGDIAFTKEDIDSIRPFKKYKHLLITYEDTVNYHTAEEIDNIYDIVNEVVRRTNKHDFTPIEKVLYAYDLIRTNLIGSQEFEEKMNKITSLYLEPSFCYAYIFRLVLDNFGINNKYSLGDFDVDDMRAFNVAYIEDETYDIKGVYYFDLSNNSKQQFENSFLVKPEKDTFEDYVVNNYKYFCKPKWFMVDCDHLDEDHMFADFDDGWMEVYDHLVQKNGINGVYGLRRIINNVSYFLDGEILINPVKGIQTQEELDDIRETIDEYTKLFSKPIDGDDFLEILFNVRQEQYKENGKVFPFSLDAFKICLARSHFALPNMVAEIDEDKEYEVEDIDEFMDETFENSFDDLVNQTKIDERIRKLKLTLNVDKNNPKKDDDN